MVSHPVNKHAHAYPERLTWCCLAGCGSSNGALCGRGGPQRWSSLGESRGSETLVNIPGEKREKQSPQPDPLVQQCRPSRPRTRGKGRDTREESEWRLCDSPTEDSGCDDDSCCSRASCRRRCCSRGESETAGASQAGDGGSTEPPRVLCQVEYLQPQVTLVWPQTQAPPLAGPHLHHMTTWTQESHLALFPSASLAGEGQAAGC